MVFFLFFLSLACVSHHPTPSPHHPHPPPHQTRFENRMHDFEICTVVGTETFGRVQIGLHKKTGTPVAIKTLSKSEVLFARHAEHVLAEHAVLKTVCGATGGYPFQFGDDGSVIDSGRNHPFLITFFGSAQDDKHVRFVMEYVPGGELFSHLRLAGNFSDAATKFYACEVLLALEFLHDLQIVYRDLKPENVLIDKDGYAVIVDLGFAKEVKGKTFTLCGTPWYIAPEVVLGRGKCKVTVCSFCAVTASWHCLLVHAQNGISYSSLYRCMDYA